jgi:hypothetical protein
MVSFMPYLFYQFSKTSCVVNLLSKHSYLLPDGPETFHEGTKSPAAVLKADGKQPHPAAGWVSSLTLPNASHTNQEDIRLTPLLFHMCTSEVLCLAPHSPFFFCGTGI